MENRLFLFRYQSKTITAKPPLKKIGLFNTLVVEMRGVEPLSEGSLTELSTSVVCVLTFPCHHARRQA